jgi:hypothetical protein
MFRRLVAIIRPLKDNINFTILCNLCLWDPTALLRILLSLLLLLLLVVVVVVVVVVFSLWVGLAGTRAQSGDRYGSGTLRSRQVLRGRLSLLSPAFRGSHPRRQMLPRPHQRERS